MVPERTADDHRTAVLLSGGLDSAVLVAHEARERTVQPIYVRVGLAWEAAEIEAFERLLAAAPFVTRVLPPVRLELTMTDVYPTTHWAVRGAAPAYDTPDEDVYLPGRNIVLLSKAGTYCAQNGIGRIALGPLAGNPFPDATAEFFHAMGRALSIGLDCQLEIATPFSTLHKAEVIRLGVALGVPLERTLSCMSPVDSRHCGLCSKCRERRDAFAAAGVSDPTVYVVDSRR